MLITYVNNKKATKKTVFAKDDLLFPVKLPKPQHMLHQQADRNDTNPAAETHNARLAAGFNQLHDVGVETDGCHSQHDKELGKLFDRCKEAWCNTHGYCNGCNDGRTDEVKNKEWENAFDVCFFTIFVLILLCTPECQSQSDWNDGQRSG